nr:hypothetical protein [Haloarcula taiwanensis]
MSVDPVYATTGPRTTVHTDRIARSTRRRRHGGSMNSDQYELPAKITLFVAKLPALSSS